MQTKFDYYYNNVPGEGKCRNNLVYTSLISNDKKTFCQWFYNDKNYHNWQNKVVDPALMEEKWNREINFLLKMQEKFSEYVLKIIDIDYNNKKIFYSIEDVDFWELSGCSSNNYDKILSDWKNQMLNIIRSHCQLRIYKFSMHPSSYFIVKGKLKSINYFFCYDFDELELVAENVFSHISNERLNKLFPLMEKLKINYKKPEPLHKLQMLTFETFKYNFPEQIMEEAKNIYVQNS